MVKEANYFQIIECIKNEFDIFEKCFKSRINCDIPEQFREVLELYFSKKGKRIRPALIFLVLRALGLEISEKHYLLAFAVEMIHNATLLHDDIIDNALIRHSLPAINVVYDSKMAVLAGDYLLSAALRALCELENSKIIKIQTNSISRLLTGEIGQYFEKRKPVSIEQYIEKSQNKTAELFKAGILSALELSSFNNTAEIEQFALNFGIAFQIRNDLAGIEDDLKNGLQTAPAIFYSEHSKDTPTYSKIQNSPAIAQTKELISFYSGRAVENICFIEDNLFKNAIIDLCKIINQC